MWNEDDIACLLEVAEDILTYSHAVPETWRAAAGLFDQAFNRKVKS